MKLNLSYECPLCGDAKTSANPHKECNVILREQRKATKKAAPRLSKKQSESAGKFFTKYGK